MSAPLVMKFGGTSLATPRRLAGAAERIALHRAGGQAVVAVVSARGGTTDRLLRSAARVGAGRGEGPSGDESGPARETDRLLSTGEDRAAALLAVALWRRGVPARSFRGGEAGVRGEGGFGAGRIVAVDPDRVRHWLARGVVPVVSGFQGLRSDGETVTLGRGGSDTTAVALAEALGGACHLVTDVDAVYDRDPATCPSAVPLGELAHDDLVALAETGARVVHAEAARRAARSGVPLRVYRFDAPDGVGGTRVGGAP